MGNFANYKLGEGVGELGAYLIPEMAETFQVPMSIYPTSEELYGLIGALGAKKTLQDNKAGAEAWLTEWYSSYEHPFGDDKSAAVVKARDWMFRSGVQDQLDRSFWLPEKLTPDGTPVVITGAVANWQDRTAQLLADREPTNVYMAVGNREMGTATEKANSNVQLFESESDRYPTESEYAFEFVKPVLEAAGCEVEFIPYETSNGQDIAHRFVVEKRELFEPIGAQVAFARVANAGIQMAAQFRDAARQAGVDFDPLRYKFDPQAYLLTDSFPIAGSDEHLRDPANYQNPFTGIRQIAITAKSLVDSL